MGMVKTQKEIELIRESGKRLARVLKAVIAATKPGVTTKELDMLAERLIREGGDTPSFLNYQPEGASYPYPATLCISVNDEVVHGLPGDRVLTEGDVVGLDLGLSHEGYHTDMAETIIIGTNNNERIKQLVSATKKALDAGVAAARAHNRVGDIGNAIEEVIKKAGFGIVEELGGHGIGEAIHEEPFVGNFGEPKTGVELVSGMVLAIEPIVTEKSPRVFIDSDGYTFKTNDHKCAAHFERTILIRAGAPEILTPL
jgi:methionyl aminopeptidase